MSKERWLRRGDDATAFDWQRSAHALEVPPEVARALYLKAIRLATEQGAPRAEELYTRWLRDAAAVKPAAPAAPVPGRRTRVMRDADRVRPEIYHLDPGRWTRTLFEQPDDSAAQSADAALPGHAAVAEAIGALGQPVAAADPTSAGGGAATPAALCDQLIAAARRGRGVIAALAGTDPVTARAALRELRQVHVPGHGSPVLRLIAQADGGAAARLLGRGSSGTPLPDAIAGKLGPHVGGEAVGAARVHTDEDADLVAAAHHAHAVTIGDAIYFARGAYEPGTERGDELLAHELTHVAQGQRGELARAAAKGIESGGALDRTEAEADLRAKLAVIELHPATTAAPALAVPIGQPSSKGDRAARIAAQNQRLDRAHQADGPQAAAPPPPISRPQPPVAHPPPAMAAAPRPASTGNAYVETFDAPPSNQATALWSRTGSEATTKAAADQARFDAALPPVPVVLDGGEAKGAKGGGATHAVKRGPAAGPVPPAAQPAPTPLPLPVTAGKTIAAGVKPIADPAQLKAAGTKAIDALPTTSPDVKTDPGPAPITDLAGQADPIRTIGDQQHAAGEGARALDAHKAKVLAGPGPAQVQPVKLDDKLEVPHDQATGAMPALPPVEGMVKLKKWNLPANAQAAFDAEAKPKMDARLTEAKAKMAQADARRDLDRSKAVADSQDKVKQAHVDADHQQQHKVAATRSQIANHQADTLLKQETEVKKLDAQSGDKKQGTLGKIHQRIQADQAKVETDYQGAQRQAEAKKQQGDADAANQKQAAQRKQQDDHWWDKAADAVVDGIQEIAADIDKALDAVCKAIGDLLDAVKDAACKVIDAARDFVCQALTEFGDWLKAAVTQLIGAVFPELAAVLDRLIDEAVGAAKAAVNAIADGLKAAVTALCDALKASLDALVAAFRAAVEAAATFAQAAITGDWSLVGKMVLDGILKMLGIDPAAFYALVGKAEDSIDKIVENPGAFVGHLVDAVKLGFKQFGANFWGHLKEGVVQWLFGAFAQAGITMPASFDIAGIFSLVAQVLGITWERMRPKLVRVVGENNAARLEFAGKYIQALMTGGFQGLWEQIQQDMSGLWDMVIGGVKQWLVEKVVEQAILKIATMWNPAGAIIQLIETAWNVYQWVKENAQRIFGLVQAVVDSVSNIVAGNIGGAASFIEASLAKLVPIAISLFADLLGLGGIADKVRGIIEKVQTKVDQAIDKLIDRVLKKFKGTDGAGGPDGKDSKDGKPGDHAVGEVITFEAAGHGHRMWFDVKGTVATLMVASTPVAVRTHLDHMQGQLAKLPADKQSTARELLGQATAAEAKATADANKATHGDGNAKDSADGKAADVDEHTVAGLMKQLFELFEGLNAEDLKAACDQAGGVAKTKYDNVMGEGQPGAAAARAAFLAGANVRLKTAPAKPLEAMRDEVSGSGDKYILRGTQIPHAEILGQDGVSRVLDLPSVFNYYLKPDYKAGLGLTSVDDFLKACADGHFDPATDLNDAAEIRGKVAESWWFAKARAGGVTLGQIKQDLTVMDTTYDRGMLRIDLTAAELAAAKVTLHKPTAFDGMMQGWGDDPMWVAAPDSKWGLTRDGMQEAVIKASTLGVFKQRKLILPQPLPKADVAAKSLVEPRPATVHAKGALAADASKAQPGQVLVDNGADAKTATTKIVQDHRDARLDAATGVLTLPPVVAPEASKPLADVAADLVQQTGVSKVTVVAGTGGEVHLRGAINPEVNLLTICPEGSSVERQRAAQQLAPIPVATLHDTHYLTADNAALMVSLFKVFAPEVQVRDYKKGFIVRFASNEWYFERYELVQPTTTAGQASPNAATYELHGFGGVRQVDGVAVRHLPADKQAAVDRLTKQYPLLWAGHVGISVDGGQRIYAFTPDKPEAMATDEFMQQLRNHQSFPGVAQDDKYIFDLAAQLHARDHWNTEVLVSTQRVTTPQKAAIVEKLGGMANAGGGTGTGHGARYQFPTPSAGADGSHFDSDHTANCAVFPTMVGAPVPEPSGQLRVYIPKLQEWVNDSPVDLRGGKS